MSAAPASIAPRIDGEERARAVAQVAAASVDTDDRSGTLAGETVAALRRSGLVAMALLGEYGGLELSPGEAARAVEIIAAANPSAAWYAAVSSSGSMASWFLPPDAVRAIWRDGPSAIIGGSGLPGGLATVEPGGIRIREGRWTWGSAGRDADWMHVLVRLEGGEAVPAYLTREGGFEMEDTWDAVGLRASSSDAFHGIPGHFVPDLFVRRDKAPRISTALTQFSSVSYQSALFCAVAIGNAAGALDEAIDLVTSKIATTSGAVLARSPQSWRDIARATILLRGARALAQDSIEALFEQAGRGSGADPALQAIARGSFASAATSATEAIRICFDLAGSTAANRSCPLQRRLRDALVVNQHYYLSVRATDLLGKTILRQDLSDFETSYLLR